MQYFKIVSVFLAVIMVAPVASAATLSDSLSRMDEIIAQMQKLRAEFAVLTTASALPTPQMPKPAVLGAQSTSFFTESLEAGETNSDIKKIQKLLATDREVYPYGVSSGFFGPKTEEGIKNFQKRFGLDPVGVVGPATKALFELFFSAYPDDIYPADVLTKKPTVLGAATTAPAPTPVAPVVTTPSSATGKSLASIVAEYASGEAEVLVKYTDGTKEQLTINGDSKLKVIDAIALKLGQKKAAVLGAIEFVSPGAGEDEDEDESDDTDEDGLQEITVHIANKEAEVEVEYANGDDEDFTLDETLESEIIEEIADELNIDEDEVEDVIEFTYDDLEKIDVTIDEEDDSALAIVTFEDGTTKRVKIGSADEDDIIEELADELDEDEDDVEDLTDFDYK